MSSGDGTGIGERLLPAVVDKWAKTNPHKSFCSLANGSKPVDGVYNVTFADVAMAADYMSWWIETTIGHGTDVTLSYMGTTDIRYFILFLACCKTEYKLFLPSPKNSDDAILYLLKKTETSMFLHSHEFRDRVESLGALSPGLAAHEIPSWEEMTKCDTQHYAYSKKFQDEQDRVVLIMHTSGTTGSKYSYLHPMMLVTKSGLPNPVFLTNGYFAAIDGVSEFPCPLGRSFSLPWKVSTKNSVLVVTPFFHIMGFLAFIQSIFWGIPFALPPPQPISGGLVIDVIESWKLRLAILPPSLIENICSTQAGIDQLCDLEFLFYGGAPLSPEVGELLRHKLNLISVIGSTEIGVILAMIPEHSEDWSYFEWAPNYNIFMDPVEGNLHELVIKRGKNRRGHAIFHTFPDISEYRSKDLFRQHPTKMGLWRYDGRLDDIIVLSNGEKFNPVSMEKCIEAHPLVSRALVVGQGHFQSGLIIEPNRELQNTDQLSSEAIVGVVWPTICEANKGTPAYGRVFRDRVAIASRHKPFKFTAKGTTQRREVNEDYREEIRALYANQDATAELGFPETPTLSSISDYMRYTIHNQLGDRRIGDGDDIYAAGFESLQTVILANTLEAALRAKYPGRPGSITVQTIYENPTIAALARWVGDFLDGALDREKVARTEKINNFLRTFLRDLPQKTQPVSLPRTKNRVVILTGSTGSLGSYLLNNLLEDPAVAKIYCLNRSEDAETRQRRRHAEWGLRSWNHDENRVCFVQAAFGDHRLGLTTAIYNTFLDTVDVVIHNAWQVNFNHPLSSFGPLIKGVRDLLDFSSHAKKRPHMFFVSSISTIRAWNASMGHSSAPESLIDNSDAVLRQGYAESKHVAERLCHAVSTEIGVPTTVLRVGQIAGPVSTAGRWNPSEWIPSLIITSKRLEKIPNSLGAACEIDWIPVDTLATIIGEIVDKRLEGTTDYSSASFHLVNPQKTSWESYLHLFERELGVQSISFSDWVHELEQIDSPTEQDLQHQPALKLLTFYQDLLNSRECSSIVVSRARAVSTTFAELDPISVNMMENWLHQWGLIPLLSSTQIPRKCFDSR